MLTIFLFEEFKKERAKKNSGNDGSRYWPIKNTLTVNGDRLWAPIELYEIFIEKNSEWLIRMRHMSRMWVTWMQFFLNRFNDKNTSTTHLFHVQKWHLPFDRRIAATFCNIEVFSSEWNEIIKPNTQLHWVNGLLGQCKCWRCLDVGAAAAIHEFKISFNHFYFQRNACSCELVCGFMWLFNKI